MATNNSYFTTDKDIDEIGKKIVTELYNNKEINDLKNNGRPLTGMLSTLVDRQISSIYSNINEYKSLQTILTNAIRFSVLIEKNSILDAEFKKLREASDRRKNMLLVLERKLQNDKKNETIESDIEKTKDEIKLLDEQLNIIANKNSEPPTIKRSILELAKSAYKLLLRTDKTSEKLYLSVCKNLNVKVENNHFGYYSNNYNNYSNNYNNSTDNYKPYYNRFNNQNNGEEKKDVYVPPQLQQSYGGYRRRQNYN